MAKSAQFYGKAIVVIVPIVAKSFLNAKRASVNVSC